MDSTVAGVSQLSLAAAGAVLIAVAFEVNPRIGGLLIFLVVMALLAVAVKKGQLK